MLKVKTGQKGRQKSDVKGSIWIQSFFSFLPSQIKSDDIPSEVKSDDVNNTEMGKAKKGLKCEHRFCLICLEACFLSGRNEEKSQCPACKINTLKTDISPSSDLQALLCHYLKYRTNHQEVFLEKGVLKICSKFAGEHPS